MSPPIKVSDLHGAWDPEDPDVATASGLLHVHLDDGRDLHMRQGDLLGAVADLAERRAVLDDEQTLLLDPLTSAQDPDEVVLQLRLAHGGDGDHEVGERHTDRHALDDALHTAWHEVARHAEETGNEELRDELDVPHSQHYWPGANLIR